MKARRDKDHNRQWTTVGVVLIAFAVPWYAVVAAQKALSADLPVIAVVMIGVISSIAGRFFIDTVCNVPPHHLVSGEWSIGSAAFAGILYIILDGLGISSWFATIITFAITFAITLLVLFRRRQTAHL